MQQAISRDQRCQHDDETRSSSDSKMSWSWPDIAHTTISSELSSLTLAVRSKKLLKMFFSKKMLKKIRRLRKNNNNNFNSSGTTTSGIERRIYFLDFLWDQKTNNWILFSPINFRIPILFCHRKTEKTEKPKNRKTEKPKNRKNGPPLLFFFSIKSKMTKGDELGIGWNFFFSRSVAKDSLDWIIKQILISFQFYQFLMGQWL